MRLSKRDDMSAMLRIRLFIPLLSVFFYYFIILPVIPLEPFHLSLVGSQQVMSRRQRRYLLPKEGRNKGTGLQINPNVCQNVLLEV